MSEEKRETTFEKAKVGDRCYSNIFGGIAKTNAVIVRIENGRHPLSITIKPDLHTGHYYFSEKGEYIIDGGQSLFWESPIKEIPVRPKRKVIKKGWMGLVSNPTASIEGYLAMTTCVYADSSEVPGMSDEKQRLIAVQFEVEE